jgi:hypothetical protein
LALERYWVYLKRSKKLVETRRQIRPLLQEVNYRKALVYCETQSTGLSTPLADLISYRSGKRELAERSIKESLIVEILILLVHGFLFKKLNAITLDLQSTTNDGLKTVWLTGDDTLYEAMLAGSWVLIPIFW